MKHFYLSFFMAALLGLTASAQEPITLHIIYEFRYVRDLERRDSPYITNTVLSVGKHQSRYCSESVFLENDSKVEKVSTQSSRPAVVASGSPMLLVNRFGAIINEEITRDFSSSRLTINAVMGPGSYEIEVPIPQIDWAITDEKKKISGYTCQKAKANVAGRMYEAWFAPDLPYQHGPWKLAGLPGLIMEARDSTNEIVFLFKELKNNSATEKKVTSFLNKPYSVKTSYKEYVRVRTAFEKDPESVMAAIAPNTKVTVYNVDGGANTSSLRIKKFNPIELD